MSSPFPGMDPYLEAQGLWPDFHSNFVNCWRELLLGSLPAEYDARLDERVYLVEMPEESARLVLPDVAVEHSEAATPGGSGSALAVTLEPVTIPLSVVSETREVYIRILHREDQSLVAVLELLSPANKSPASQGVYLEKRAEIIRSPVHLVELDLLMAGHRLPMGKPLPPGHYYAFVSRAERRPQCEVYAWRMEQKLPVIPIPLKAPDPDLTIDLGEVFRMAWKRGRYERAIDYRKQPELPVDKDEMAWLVSQAAGR